MSRSILLLASSSLKSLAFGLIAIGSLMLVTDRAWAAGPPGCNGVGPCPANGVWPASYVCSGIVQPNGAINCGCVQAEPILEPPTGP